MSVLTLFGMSTKREVSRNRREREKGGRASEEKLVAQPNCLQTFKIFFETLLINKNCVTSELKELVKLNVPHGKNSTAPQV